MKDNILTLWEKIKKAETILLISHIRMDPDTFGSMCALYLILKKLEKQVEAINDDTPPETFAFLWMNGQIKNNFNITQYNPDLIISLDAASLWQLWETYTKHQTIFEEKDFIVIDHHITNPWFWKINIIDTKASSTCELVFEILETLQYDTLIDAKIATLLNAGILTDTNIYYNVNTTPKTLKIAAKLLEYGSNFRAPMFEFFKKKEFHKTKLWWEILKDIKQAQNGEIVWAIVPKALYKQTSTSSRDISWIINEFLSNIEKVKVSFIVYEIEEWWVKVSFRSSNFDVSNFCTWFWWWWHKQAAWFTSQKSLQEIEKEILEVLKKEKL